MGLTAEEQIKQCKVAKVASYDAEEHIYHISKYSKPTYDAQKYYIVKVASNFVNNPNTVLAINWNRGTAPQTEYLYIYVEAVSGGYMKVEARGYDIQTDNYLDNYWSGWLEINETEQIRRKD